MFDEPTIIVALISAFVSVITVLLSFLLKAWFERHFTLFKLEAEYRYEQKKKVKEVVAKYKIQLINRAESLNNRFWNFSSNYKEMWHETLDIANYHKSYYLTSFVYRILTFYAWVNRIEKKMIYLDTTIASQSDLYFLKYLKLFNQIMCDVGLYDGLAYDINKARDHFFSNDFVLMFEDFIQEEEVISFSEFNEEKSIYLDKARRMASFLNGIKPNASNYRWDRLQMLHVTIIMFLNSFGYDFQYTNEKQIETLIKQVPPKECIIENFEKMLSAMKLNKQKHIKRALAVLKKNEIWDTGVPVLT